MRWSAICSTAVGLASAAIAIAAGSTLFAFALPDD